MSVPAAQTARHGTAALQGFAPLLAVGGAALLLYAPTFTTLAGRYWQDPTHSHGPLVLLACVALFVTSWQQAAAMADATPPSSGGVALLMVAALLLHALGELSGTVQLSVLSLPPLLAAMTLWAGGGARLRAQGRFPYVFLLFLVPWPVWMTDPVTQPLKTLISLCTEQLLHSWGYPIARDGVVLHLGGYQLQVADACSGINSLFMLEAFGLLYIHLLRAPSPLRQTTLAALILPISFSANLLRVIALALLTFHGGNDLGQGLLHEGSGLLLFTLAVLMLAPMDALLRRWAPTKRAGTASPSAPMRWKPPGWLRAAPLLLAFIALHAALQSSAKQPTASPAADLQHTLPDRVGDWHLVGGGPDLIVLTSPGEAQVYDQQVVRTYEDSQGRLLMLNIAWVHQAMRIADTAHDPRACYPGQGFQLVEAEPATFAGVQGQRLLARRGARLEVVSYWLRTGSRYGAVTTGTRFHLLSERIANRVPDSLLARASMLIRHPDEAADAHKAAEGFLAALVDASPTATRALLRP
ncbi:exosortase C-terminal domain/associated protein EpsI [Roseateles sp. DC23W]|uniref:Exosortase C-terminal domain/associated protein EpsI n=1 Tax=Pelomonas dachongensis TaxID=3299029 RepID=A0ABW7EUJ9_9BURK